MPPVVPLTFQANCGTVTRCGGGEVGVWAYSAGCIDDSAFQYIEGVASKFGCTGQASNKSGSVSGALMFMRSVVDPDEPIYRHEVLRRYEGEVNYTLTLTGGCVAQCASAAGLFPAGTTGTCAASGATCVCTMRSTFGHRGGYVDYAVDAGLLSVGGAPPSNPDRTYDTCITAGTPDTFTYRETTGIPGRDDPGRFTLSRH